MFISISKFICINTLVSMSIYHLYLYSYLLYIYIYFYTYTYVYLYFYLSLYLYLYFCVLIFISIFIFIIMFISISMYVCINIHLFMCIYIDVCVRQMSNKKHLSKKNYHVLFSSQLAQLGKKCFTLSCQCLSSVTLSSKITPGRMAHPLNFALNRSPYSTSKV